jgi:hypothetical protein
MAPPRPISQYAFGIDRALAARVGAESIQTTDTLVQWTAAKMSV